MRKKKNKNDSWYYTTAYKESRIKVKRLRNKADRRLEKYEIEEHLH